MDLRSVVDDEEFESTKAELRSIVSRKHYETWAKTIVAFANTEGGTIFFGVDDDENAIGIAKQQAKDDVLYINDIIDRKIHPRIRFEIKKTKVGEDLFVLELKVMRNDNIPVWLLRTDEQEVIYVRRDGQSVIARGDQIERLVLASKRAPYDQEFTEIPYDEASYQDLARLYREAKGPGANLSAKLLQSVGAISVDGFVSRGLLLFADRTEERNCNVVCRTWPGLSKGSSVLLDKKEFRGNIPSLLDFARDYIRFYSKTGLVKNNGKGRKDVLAYPERAVEEALINAVAHRDYFIDGSQIDIDIFANRLEITSPGSFLLPGNAQDYAMNRIPSRRRNEVICGILELCDLMERSGSGFEKIAACYEGYPMDRQPKAYSDPAQFVVTLFDLTFEGGKIENPEPEVSFSFRSPRSGNREYDRKILEYCLDSAKSRNEIQEYLELSDRKSFVTAILNPLLDSELLLPTQPSVFAPNQKYIANKDKLRFEE